MTAGEDFVKKIRPVGAAIFLGIAVLMISLCLTSGKNPIPGYEAPQTTEYYAAHLPELAEELEAHVLPCVEGAISCAAGETTVTVTLQESQFAVARAAILYYFDDSLLEFVSQ